MSSHNVHGGLSARAGRRRWAVACCLLLPIVGAAGCKRSSTVSMFGTVTLDGKPLEEGLMNLMPVDQSGGTTTGAIIKAGQYKIEAAKGVRREATYRVEISSTDSRPAKSRYEVIPNLVPPIYNTESTLTVSVPADASHVEQNFELDSRKK